MKKGEFKLNKVNLRNGITVLLKENHATPVVSVCAYFRGGCRDEDETINGISYLVQKLILKGTSKYSAIEIAFKSEAIGSILVPFIGKDSFGWSISLLAKHIEEGLDILADCLFNPLFLELEIEKEKKIVLAEIKESKDDLLHYTLEFCNRALFSQHPYRLPIKGNEEAIKALSRDNLIDWHQRYYRPGNMVLAIIGDIQPEKILSCIEKIFSSLQNIQFTDTRPRIEEKFQKRELIEERDKKQLSLAIGFVAPAFECKDRFSFEVLNGILSGMGSRLFIELRDKRGLAYIVYSQYESLYEYGIYKVYIGTDPRQETMAKDGLLQELSRLREEEVSEDEIKRAKRYLVGLQEISMQKTSVQASRYARFEALGVGYQAVDKYSSMIEEVKAEEIIALARKYLVIENYSLAAIRPRKV